MLLLKYTRTYPVYKEIAHPGYVKPKAPVYIVNGAAGNREQLSHGWMDPKPG